jgi:hypothetical protein
MCLWREVVKDESSEEEVVGEWCRISALRRELMRMSAMRSLKP